MLNLHTSSPEVFWNGVKVEGVKRVHVHNDEDDHRVKLVVSGTQDQLYAEMIVGGIHVRKV